MLYYYYRCFLNTEVSAMSQTVTYYFYSVDSAVAV